MRPVDMANQQRGTGSFSVMTVWVNQSSGNDGKGRKASAAYGG